ncbi:MAG: transposase [Patescibacteria group bacterium]|nr:transposase [Patescibacteria group bacterium]
MRKTKFTNWEYYHIYNRGVDKRKIFGDTKDYERFLISIELLNDKNDGLMTAWKDFERNHPRAKLSDFPAYNKKRKRIVDFIAYCINPNHYHFILKQLADRGIERFMHKLGTSYTNYFNTRSERSGSLFQGSFKAVRIESNAKLLYLSAYINENHIIHGYKNKLWKYSSLLEYLGKRKTCFCNKNVIMDKFNNSSAEYAEFLKENSSYAKDKKEWEKYYLE